VSLSHLFNEMWLKSFTIHSILCILKYKDVTKSTGLGKYTSELGRQGNKSEKKKKRKGDEGRTHELHGSLLNIKGTVLLTTI